MYYKVHSYTFSYTGTWLVREWLIILGTNGTGNLPGNLSPLQSPRKQYRYTVNQLLFVTTLFCD